MCNHNFSIDPHTTLSLQLHGGIPPHSPVSHAPCSLAALGGEGVAATGAAGVRSSPCGRKRQGLPHVGTGGRWASSARAAETGLKDYW